jgi:hypothetical protein
MTTFDLTPCHPMLLALHVLATDDGFQLTKVESRETAYTRAHAGWTTRVRAVVLLSKPDCICCYSEGCNDDGDEYIRLEIETELEGLGLTLRGDVATRIHDAVWSYVANVRAVVRAFPLRLLRTRLHKVDTSAIRWPETPFYTGHVLAYLASIRWQEGTLDDARECYARLLEIKYYKRLFAARVQERIEELSLGLAFESRVRMTIGWL